MDNIILAQREFFQTGETKNIKFRLLQLKRLYDAIIKYEYEIYSSFDIDLGKSKQETYMTEISPILSEIKYLQRNLSKWSAPIYKPTTYKNLFSRNRLLAEPYGLVLIIAPWNYPLHLSLMPMVGALAAGNCVVLKPSFSTPNVQSVISKIITASYLERSVFVVMDREYAYDRLFDYRYDYIFFTGSTDVGKKIMHYASDTLTPVSLELGGKSPVIVDKKANVDITARRIVWGKLLNSGQTCIAPDYIFVHNSVKEELVERLKYYCKAMYPNNEYAKIIDNKAMERLIKLIDSDKNKIIFGGSYDISTRKVEPTIFDNVTPDDALMQQEIFGPLFPILTFDSLEEPISFINSKNKPLALYYFGTRHKRIINETSSGSVVINDVIMQLTNHHLPFGGVGSSGMGAYHGKYSFDTFSHYKPIVKSPTWFDLRVKYSPFKRFNLFKKIL